jgi:hypothetical protein
MNGILAIYSHTSLRIHARKTVFDGDEPEYTARVSERFLAFERPPTICVFQEAK